jgi:HEPN domain-containing protein
MRKNKYIIWLKRAKSNLGLAKRNWMFDEIFLEDLCHNCHEAAEKALKGLLIFFDEIPPRTHNILALAQEISKYIPVPEQITDIGNILNPYAIEAKYPDDDDDDDYTILKDEYEQAYAASEECITWVISEIERRSQKQLDLRR